eukprot:tig00021352_g20706.t1
MQVGKYIIGKALGRGEYGEVFDGQNVESGDKVAVKKMDRRKIEDEKRVPQVMKEIKNMSSLCHPNIVELKDVVFDDSHLYVVLERVQGMELYEKVASSRALDEDTARNYFRQIVAGVEYCHKRRICHRDLKLENVMIEPSTGLLKLIDFGFSRHLSQDSVLQTMAGTNMYMAPEIFSGKQYQGEPVDVWALGVILYVMLVGQYPFGNPSMNWSVLMRRVTKADFSPIPNRVSREAADLIRKILTVDVKERLTLDTIKQHAWFRGRDAPLEGESHAHDGKPAPEVPFKWIRKMLGVKDKKKDGRPATPEDDIPYKPEIEFTWPEPAPRRAAEPSIDAAEEEPVFEDD